MKFSSNDLLGALLGIVAISPKRNSRRVWAIVEKYNRESAPSVP